MRKIALEVSAQTGPASGRGIGRYVAAVRDANGDLGNVLHEIDAGTRPGRLAEFVALEKRGRLLRAVEADVFHAPTAYTAVTPRPDMATVTSILDVIPLMLPGYARTGIKARFFHRVASGADVITTLSRHAASEISRRLGVDAERIVIASLPPAKVFSPSGKHAELKTPYVAALVDLSAEDVRKRAHWLTPIARELDRAGASLVVCGRGTESLTGSGLKGLGWVADDHWAQVLRGALAFVYTSAYEGQGMPPLEAIACGTPVVAMNNSAIPEVVGDAGILVTEETSDGDGQRSLANALLRVVSDSAEQQVLRANCHKQVEMFSAQRFAGQLKICYEQALAERL